MWETWKDDIRRAIWLVVVVAVAAILVNWIRTPMLIAAANGDRISHATAYKMRGADLTYDWHAKFPPIDPRFLTDEVEPVETEPKEPGPDENDDEEPPPGVDPELWFIDITTAKEYLDDGECIFFDARDLEYYEEGHIPGAINWPADDFDLLVDEKLDGVSRGDCMVIYCVGGSCDESYHLGQSLVLEGYYEVYLFEGGMEEWEFYGYPVTSGTDP